MLYGHGNELMGYEGKIIADFSSNVNPNGIAPALKEHLCEVIQRIANYPEPDAYSLQLKLSMYHRIDTECIAVTNGSTEAFYMLAQLYGRNNTLIYIPSFSEYEDACKLHRHTIMFGHNESPLQRVPEGIEMLWLGNPNNPDGKTVSRATIRQFCTNHPNITLIIDEAYADLCAGFESSVELVEKFPNLVVVRSLTKSFAIPGLRLGYLVASPHITSWINQIRQPWTVNALAIEAGKFILDNYTTLLPNVNEFVDRSLGLQRKLTELDYLTIHASRCNFFHAQLSRGTSSKLKTFLIENKGILIRDASNFRGLNNKWIRLSIQDSVSNNLLIEGLKEWKI